jgi:hypothetical protein
MNLAKKSIQIALVLTFLGSGCLFGQLSFYKIPKLSSTSVDRSPAIASNNLGDIMVIYSNNTVGATYYYKSHDSSSWTGPLAIPNQTYSNYIKSYIYWTDITSTSDNVFHAVWAVDSHLSEGYGMYYATFSPATNQWSNPASVATGRIGEPKLITNPINDDLVMIWDWYLQGAGASNKDIFIKVKNKTGWQAEINISKLVSDASTIVDAPHGQLAETNAAIAIDENDGYVYLTWKEDQYVESLADEGLEPWELRIHVALLDPNYNLVWNKQVTEGYSGFHFLPSIAALNGQAIVMFAWPQEGTYNYIVLTRAGNKLTYNSQILKDNWMAPIPTILNRWYAWHNHLHAHGDEIIDTYADAGLFVRMRIMKNWVWQTGPLDLSQNERQFYYPYDSYSDPKIGILTAFQNWHEGADDNERELRAEICISIYNYPKIITHSAINVTVTEKTERSFFKSFKFNLVSWQNHPLNTNLGVTVNNWRIYRKTKSDAVGAYVKIGEVPGTSFSFPDPANISAQNLYDYFVTGVDDKGNESLLPKN